LFDIGDFFNRIEGEYIQYYYRGATFIGIFVQNFGQRLILSGERRPMRAPIS